MLYREEKMSVNHKRVAIFLCKQNLYYVESVLEDCKKLEKEADIYIGEGSSHTFENLGINVSASFLDYDYVVMINPFEKLEIETDASYFQRQTYYIKNMIGSLQALEKHIAILEESDVEGMLISPVDYIKACNLEHYETGEKYYPIIEKYVKEQGLKVPIEKNKMLIAENCCAVIKTKALQGFEKLRGEIFEPQFMSQLIPLYIQSRGFLTGYCISKEIMANNLFGYEALNRYNRHNGNTGHNMQIVSKIYYDFGEGFVSSSKDDIKSIVKFWKKDRIEFLISVPNGTQTIKFTPCVGFMCVCAEVKTDIEDIKIRNANGISFEKEDVFLTYDPQYLLEGDFSKVKQIKVIMENISVFWSEHDFKYEIDKYIEEKERGLHQQALKIQQLQDTLEVAENELAIIKGSKAWKFITKYRDMKNRILKKK